MNINYRFKDTELLQLALTHRSAATPNNERLEFLGDAILDTIITEYLYTNFPDANEGAMTRTRASLVNKKSLAAIARELDIGDNISLGEGELKSGGWQRESILSNTLEAIIGAIFLDGGLDACQAEVLDWYSSVLTEVDPGNATKDPKTQLQEILQGKNLNLPIYETVKVEGPAHNQLFTVRCSVELLPDAVIETANSRRNAEQRAARAILDTLAEHNS
ncbi:MAG: ribonuclease III [Gammaproteobacteria bacterium]